MAIKNTTKTTDISNLVDSMPDPEDAERDLHLEKGLLSECETVEGIELQPITGGTMALLQRSGNKLIWGETDNIFFDVAGFVLLHSKDTAKQARAAIYANAKTNAFDEMIFEFLDGMENSGERIAKLAEHVSNALRDYYSTETQQIGGTAQQPGK